MEEFDFTQIDQANNNVAFIFEQFYLFFLIKELRLYQNTKGMNKTSIQVNKTSI